MRPSYNKKTTENKTKTKKFACSSIIIINAWFRPPWILYYRVPSLFTEKLRFYSRCLGIHILELLLGFFFKFSHAENARCSNERIFCAFNIIVASKARLEIKLQVSNLPHLTKRPLNLEKIHFIFLNLKAQRICTPIQSFMAYRALKKVVMKSIFRDIFSMLKRSSWEM